VRMKVDPENPQHDMPGQSPGLQSNAQQAWAKAQLSNAMRHGHAEKAGDHLSEALRKWKLWFKRINRQNGFRGTKKYTIANFMFLVIIAGTEMDMAGLFLSAPIYLKYHPFYEILLAFVVQGFCLPLIFVTLKPFIGMCCSSQGEAQMDQMFSGMVPQEFKTGNEQQGGFLAKYLTRINPHGGDMQFFHWVPGIRFYLVVKANYTPSDVDALFRVNSISTFTFGIFQVIGVMATALMKKPFDLYVNINIATQILNWLITMAYFGTGISGWMGTAGTVRMTQNHYRGIATEYCRLRAILMEQNMDDSAQAKDSQRKIDRMEKVLGDMLETAYFGREVEEVNTQKNVLDGSDSEAEISEDARLRLEMQMQQEGAIAAEHMKTARKMFRKDIAKMRPIDVSTFLEVLKEQSITCLD